MATTYSEGKVIHHDGEAPPSAAADETKTANVPEGARTAPAARSPRPAHAPTKTTAAKAKPARKHKT